MSDQRNGVKQMTALTFNVQLNRHGGIVCKAEVPAHEAGIVGDWYEGKPYQPSRAEVRAAIPFQYRAAFDRSIGWWQESTMSGRLMPLKMDLLSLKRQPLGTLYATPNWAAI